MWVNGFGFGHRPVKKTECSCRTVCAASGCKRRLSGDSTVGCSRKQSDKARPKQTIQTTRPRSEQRRWLLRCAAAAGCGGLWQAAAGCGRLRRAAAGCGRLRQAALHCGGLRQAAASCAALRQAATGCDRLRQAATGCDRLRQAAAGRGRPGRRREHGAQARHGRRLLCREGCHTRQSRTAGSHWPQTTKKGSQPPRARVRYVDTQRCTLGNVGLQR